MPDPTAHADDMLSPAEYTPPPVKDILPDFWWLNPWNTVLGLLHKVDHLKSVSRGEQAARIEAAGLALQATRERKDLLLAMEREVKRIPGYHSLENSIDLVKWAVDEVIDLRKEIRDAKAELTEAKENVLTLVAGNERADRDMTKAEARIKQLTMFCENAGAERDYEKKRVEQITLLVNERDRTIAGKNLDIDFLDSQVRSLKRKLSKAEKAKPLLWEDKTKTLTHGVSFTLGNHEDRHNPVREAYAALGRKFLKAGIKAKAKAKKKGGTK